MATLKGYRVLYHITRGGSPKSEVFSANVAASSGDENTIKTLLSNNNKGAMSGDAISILSISPLAFGTDFLS